MPSTKELRKALKSIFYPHAQSLGFEVDPRRQPQFVDFRRFESNVIHVFDIQWDKYHRPKFVLNFSEAPLGDVEFGDRQIQPKDICTAHCGSFNRLQRSRGGGLSNWFQTRRPLLEQVTSFKRNYEPEEVAAQVVLYFDEIEDWWSEKSIGPHIQELK